MPIPAARFVSEDRFPVARPPRSSFAFRAVYLGSGIPALLGMNEGKCADADPLVSPAAARPPCLPHLSRLTSHSARRTRDIYNRKVIDLRRPETRSSFSRRA